MRCLKYLIIEATTGTKNPTGKAEINMKTFDPRKYEIVGSRQC